MPETTANYLLSSCFSSRADVEGYIACESDPVVKFELEAHLAHLVRTGVTGINYLHYGGVVTESTLAARVTRHRSGTEGFPISRAASSATLGGTFVHVRVAAPSDNTTALQIEAIMGQAFGLGSCPASASVGFREPNRGRVLQNTRARSIPSRFG